MKRIQTCLALLALIISSCVFIPTNLAAQPYVIELVADTITTMPGSPFAYGDFLEPVSLVTPESEAYYGSAGVVQGIYNNVGGTINIVADNLTPVPGGVGNFMTVSQPVSLGAGADVTFTGTSFANQGVYTSISGTLALVADTSTVLPGAVGTPTFFQGLESLGSGDVAFIASNFIGQRGIYRHFGGALQLVADTSTPIPGGVGTFTNLDPPKTLSGGNLVFRGHGSGGQSGLYAFIGGVLVLLVDENTLIPGGTGNFTTFQIAPVGIGGNDIVFEGLGASSQNGIYKIISGVLSVVVDRGDIYPGGAGNFTNLSNEPTYLDTPGDFAFTASGNMGERGILVSQGGVVSVAVENTDPIPGGVGDFTAFSKVTSLGGGDIAFEGRGSSSQSGIYTLKAGMVALVADENTAVPGGSGNFSTFSFIMNLGGGNVGFRASEPANGDGLYDFIGGTLGLVANRQTPVPGGFGGFTNFSDSAPVLGAFEMSFQARSDGQRGIYTHISNTLALVADRNTPIPGGVSVFNDFIELVSLGNDDVVFLANGEPGMMGEPQKGYYSHISGALALVADLKTSIPGGTGTFIDFPECTSGIGGGGGLTGGAVELSSSTAASPVLDTRNIVSPTDGDMAFLGEGSSGQIGVYSSIGGVLGVIADTSTPIPGGTGNFNNFTCVVSLDNGEVAFLGVGPFGQAGIYATMGGSIIVIADTSTTVPDGFGTYSAFGLPVSIDGGDVAFLALFGFSSRGIYRSIGGVLSRVVDSSTPVPGGGGFFSALTDPVSLGGGDVAFKGDSFFTGIYSYIGGTLDIVVDSNVLVPGGIAPFFFVGNPVVIGLGVGSRDIAFIGFGFGGENGIYISLPSGLTVVADLNTPIPGGVGNFIGFPSDPVALARRDIAFRAFGEFSQHGIYNALNGAASLTIVKDATPSGTMGFGFQGTGFPASGCSLDGSFSLDDGGFEMCDLMPGTYTVQETNSLGFAITDIDCVGAASFSETADSVTVNLATSEIVVCTFTNLLEYTLDIMLAGTGTGTVTSAPGTITCGMQCSDDFAADTMVDLSAAPSMGSVFTGWSGSAGCTGTNTDITITMDAAKTCTATFDIAPVTITVAKTGNGDGGVMSTPAGIDCGSSCNADFTFNSMVTLTATPDADSNFVAWTGAGDCAGATPAITVTADAAKTCTVEFTLMQFDVDVVVDGVGTGTVTYTPGSAVCPGDCSETFNIHTMVTLTPTPTGNSVFAGWSGPADCQDGIIQDLTQDITCTATFNPNTFSVTINLAGSGMGNVSAAGIDCGDGGADCTEIYTFGTEVTLVPTPNAISVFSGFSGDPDCDDGVLTIDGDKVCTATFSFVPLIINPLFPSVANNINTLSAEGVTPNGNVAFLWGASPGLTTVNGSVCNGLELGIKNPNILSIVRSSDAGIATLVFFIPEIGNLDFQVHLQAVDISSCRAGNVVPQSIRRE